MTTTRVVVPETLDRLAADDPAARRSRRDLTRLHRLMATRSIVGRGWRHLLPPARSGSPLRVLELGAGDGRLLLGVARALAADWPPVQLCLLDRLDIVAPATLAAYGELGWTARVQVADVRDWAAARDEVVAGLPAPRWDLITTTLFLHHFGDDELERLLAAAAARCDRFFACEPRRTWPALVGSHLVGAIGANAVTRQDAVLSVHAGFRGTDLSTRWPRSGAAWQLRESAAGLFSHAFSASRSGVLQ